MSSINSVVLVGNATRDAEVKYLQSGTAVANVGIATNRKYGENEEVCFVDLTFFGKLAETVGQYVTKGKQIGVTGRLKHETWETDGQKRSKHVVVCENLQLLGSPNGSVNSKESKGSKSEKGEKEEEQPAF